MPLGYPQITTVYSQGDSQSITKIAHPLATSLFYLYTHSRMEHYFFSYLLTCEVYLMEVLEIMAQMLQYITFLSLKSIEVSSDFILNYLKKVVGGATTQKYQKQMLKP